MGRSCGVEIEGQCSKRGDEGWSELAKVECVCRGLGTGWSERGVMCLFCGCLSFAE